MTRVLVYYPQNPYPPASGFHRRGMQMMSALHEIGCEVTIASTPLTASPKWTPQSIAHLKATVAHEVILHRPSPTDWRILKTVKRWYRWCDRTPPFLSMAHWTPGLRTWFGDQVERLAPEAIFMNYAYWDPLIDHRRFSSVLRVMETIDLLTLNLRMWEAVARHLPPFPIDAATVDEALLGEDFFDSATFAADPREYAVYDRYDYTIAIARAEAEEMRRNTSHTKVVYLPMTERPVALDNRYDGPAILATGPNPFNVQGYLYFVRRVLPLLRRLAPAFALDVTGHCNAERVRPAESVTLRGFVNDLDPLFASARFAICPVFGGTGQQIKIVEAMARGLPVVALRRAALRSPIEHGVNGFAAANAQEFAEAAARLWNDPALCRRMGAAARAAVGNAFSPQRVLDTLAAMLRRQPVRNGP